MKYLFLSTLAVFSLVLFTGAAVAEPVACQSCSGYSEGAFMRSGGPENSGDVGLLVCQGGVWIDRNPTATQNELRHGLVARWKFDETSGTAAADSSGNNLAGTLANGPVWQPSGGRLGGALQFDGTDDVVTVNDPGTGSILDFPSGSSITISAWVKRTGTGDSWQAVVYKGANSAIKYGFAIASGKPTFGFHATGWRQIQTTGTIPSGSWQFVAVTYTFGTGPGALYVNGADAGLVQTNSPYTANPGVSNAQLQIGNNSHNEKFSGQLDDIRIYNRVLSPQEILYLYNYSGPAGSCP